MRSETERLQDILDAFALIREHGTDDLERYERDVVLRWFLLKQVEIIGEAVFRLSAETLAAHPSVPWDKIRRTRHILVHDYHDVNWEILWDILQTHLAPLRAAVVRMLEERAG